MSVSHVVGPHNRNRHVRALGPLVMYALALGTLLASSAYPQVLAGTILLPDSLGPLYGKNHVAFDEDSVHPRIFIGDEGGDVIVANAVTYERFARIRSGPMNALCYVPAHNKLYVSTTDEYGVAVVDCATYEVTKCIPFSSLVTGLYYNPRVDRVCCASDPLMVVDCTSDSIVDSLSMDATGARCALDNVRNKLYVSASDSLRVVDCSNDSVVACLYGQRGAQAICFQPRAGKVYVAAGESLFALNTEADTVIYRQRFDTLDAQLACDPVHNRVYYTYWSNVFALDCATDSMIWDRNLWARAIGLAAIPTHNKLHMMLFGLGCSYDYVLDGASGQTLCRLETSGFLQECSLYVSLTVNRAFLVTDNIEAASVDCDADSICGSIPLSMSHLGIYNMCVDSVHNKLYFCIPSGGARGYFGVVDCASNKVTSYSTAFDHPSWMTYIPDDDRLYVCGYDSSIFVYDCAAETVLKVIRTGADHRVYSLYWHRPLNKLYAVVVNYPDDSARLAVIERPGDTIVKSVGLRAGTGPSFLVPELNQLWTFQGLRYYVFDCVRDSMVTDTVLPRNCRKACISPADGRAYAFTDSGLYVIDMATGLVSDSIAAPTKWYFAMGLSVVQAHRVYWRFVDPHGTASRVFALDTRTDEIVATFTVPLATQSEFISHGGRYVHYVSDTMVTVDSRTDSVVSRVLLPRGFDYGAANDATRRLYLASICDSILVVYDSVVVGVEESMETTSALALLQSLVSRALPFRCATCADLFDATGRRAAILKTGLNDIRRLAPGIYFAREKPQAGGRKQQAVNKIVIAE